MLLCLDSYIFFFQAEDGIRDSSVTGVQTCALPISSLSLRVATLNDAKFWIDAMNCGAVIKMFVDEFLESLDHLRRDVWIKLDHDAAKIGRASCRERV